jgi:hypothetical protein
VALGSTELGAGPITRRFPPWRGLSESEVSIQRSKTSAREPRAASPVRPVRGGFCTRLTTATSRFPLMGNPRWDARLEARTARSQAGVRFFSACSCPQCSVARLND